MKNSMKKRLLAIARTVLLLGIALSGCLNAAERWVDGNYTAGGGNDGHTWNVDAFNTIGGAVAASSSGDVITVNDGVYTGAGNKNINVNVRLTIRSAAGAATAIIDLENSGRAFLFGSSATYSSLQGLTIRNGRITASGFPDGYGGGVQAGEMNLTVQDCVFSNNRTTTGGGAISITYGGSLTVLGCRFSNSQGSRGGAISLSGSVAHTIQSSIFENNHAVLDGGGIYSSSARTSVRSCLFSGNSAGGDGGGIYYSADDDTGRIVNCTFVNNAADYHGGGLAIKADDVYTISVSNSIFWGNTAVHDGPQIRADGGMWNNRVSVPVDHSVVQGGQGGIFLDNGATGTYDASNLASDPQFVSASDFHLSGTSPCRDSGTNTPPGGVNSLDADGQPRVQNGIVDRGALEYPALPTIALSSTAFQFNVLEGGENPAVQVMSISNSGVGTLNWTAAETCEWLALSPDQGESMGEADDVALQVDATGLSSGQYACEITVSDPAAGNSPQIATVNLTVGRVIVVPDEYATIQAALDAASSVDHILLRDGTYSGPDNRNLVVEKRLTLRSENGPEAAIIDCEGNGRAFSFQTAASNGSVLEGITIRNGHATGTDFSGGAIQCDETALTLRDCIFLENRADGYGGAVFTSDSDLVVEACIFRRNQGQITGGLQAGSSNISLTIIDSVFDANAGLLSGAGGALLGCDSTVRRCRFIGNTTSGDGGGVYTGSAAVEMSDSLFAGNHADRSGGALWVWSSDRYTRLINCTIVNNTVGVGGRGGGVSHQYTSSGGGAGTSLYIYNAILWGNTVDGMPDQIHGTDAGADLFVDYSAVQGGEAAIRAVNGATLTYGAGNLDADPMFMSATIFSLQEASPCLDAGSSDTGVLGTPLSATDLMGNPRVDSDEVDMGAYEYAPSTTPLIGVSHSHFNFMVLEGDANPPPQTLSITNTGIDTLNWTIGESCPWLSVTPVAGDATTETDEVMIQVDVSGLATGEYSWEISVVDPNALNSPQSVAVTLFVSEQVFVPDDHPTIQAALDAAIPGDVITLRDGVYMGDGNKNLDANGKAVTVRGQNGARSTVIDCEEDGRGFLFQSGETAATVIQGITIRNARVTGNGGAILCEPGCSPQIMDCVFENNVVSMDELPDSDTGMGGALYAGATANPVIQNCRFARNKAFGNGGAVYLYGSRASLSGCIFDGNRAVYYGGHSGLGGAILAHTAYFASIADCAFSYNAATRGGGAIYQDSDSSAAGSATITRSTFLYNASFNGGALNNAGSVICNLSSCFFAGNLAEGNGGAIASSGEVVKAATLNVTNCTLSNNRAAAGGGIWNGPSSEVNVANSILWHNEAGGSPNQVTNHSDCDASEPCGARLTIGYSNIEGGLAGVVNSVEGSVTPSGVVLRDDPLLVLSDDPHLLPGSPCIDAGTNSPAAGLPTTDLDGNPRIAPAAGRVDMGACEYDATSASIAMAVTPDVFNLAIPAANTGPITLSLLMRSSGTEGVNWAITADCPWVSADPSSGAAGGEVQNVAISVDGTALTPGVHTCLLTVTDAGGNAPSQTVVINVTVTKTMFVSASFDPLSDDFATIQEAIDAAADGDTVMVRSGVYTGTGNVNLDYKGKAITLRAEDGPQYTILDCQASGRAVRFHSGEGDDAIFEGFQVRNGMTADSGAGVLIEYSSPKILNCVFSNNYASDSGGAIFILNSARPVLISGSSFTGNIAEVSGGAIGTDNALVSITDGTFKENEAGDSGGAISNHDSSSSLVNCLFQENGAWLRGGAFSGVVTGNLAAELRITNSTFAVNRAANEGQGGAVYLASGIPIPGNEAVYNASVTNCTFFWNRANFGQGGGLYIISKNTMVSRTSLANCIIWSNFADNGGGVYVAQWAEAQNAYVDMSHCDISMFSYDNSTLGINDSNELTSNGNNIQVDPQFNDRFGLDFTLSAASPCIDAGKTIVGLHSDQRGSMRPVDGDNDGEARFDMGAIEYSRYFGGDGEDSPAKPFSDLDINGRRIIIGYEYKVLWNDKPPFPDSDPRISEAGKYDVTIALVDDSGRRLDLVTTSKALVTLQDAGYSVPFTFKLDHIGTWRLRLEFASDPDQYILSEEYITIEYQRVTDYVIGREIPPPAGAWPGQQPDVADVGLCFWSPYSNKLFAVAPGTTTVTWHADEGKEQPMPVLVGNVWPSNPRIHVAGCPSVELLPAGSPYNSVVLRYSGMGATLTGSEFAIPDESYSVLNFYHTEARTEKFEVVRTLFWHHEDDPEDPNDPVFPFEDTWNIGDPIIAPDAHNPACGGGYVLNAASSYDGHGDDRAHDRSTREGPIIPVNEDLPGRDNDLVVVWYEKDAEGICWPYYPVRYETRWPDEPVDADNPSDADRPVKTPEEMPGIVVETGQGTGPLLPATYGSPDAIQVYNQPDINLPGYNPNEEHALIQTSSGQYPVLFAIRNDLNRDDTSRPYALLKYQDPDTGGWKIKVYKVLANQDTGAPDYVPFLRDATSGMLINPPHPLPGILSSACEGTGPIPGSGPSHTDINGEVYALQPDPERPVVINFSYPLQAGFYYDLDGDGQQDAQPGDCISWDLVLAGAESAGPVHVTYQVRWPDATPVLQVSETLMTPKNGLPDINNQCSVKLLYGQDRVRLIDPLARRAVPLASLPFSVDFDDLPFHLSQRIDYSEDDGELSFEGYLDDEVVGEPLLLVNIMSRADRDLIKALNLGPAYQAAVDNLYAETREQLVDQFELSTETAESKALTAGAADSTGYVILAFNDDDDCIAPVDLEVIRVECPPYAGEIKVIEPENVFDNRVILRHSGDFGGDPDVPLFQWKWWEDDHDRPADVDDWKDWLEEQGAAEIVIQGEGEVTLSDKWFVVRYQVAGGPCGPVWSDWTAPQLYQGWIKRILAAINLFDQRFGDFHENEVNTVASMIMQAGEGYEGDVALNYDPDNLNALGLIQFYQTVLNMAQELTIDAAQPQYTAASNQQLLLMASRLADLYMLLGNEAFADAIDPTIGFSTDDEVGSAATSIFCFQNQVATLLEEEMALLRGTDDEGLRPYYNRLVWNFTQTEGEVAYSQNYSIFDWNGDGFLDEYDARYYFPQGHGDAWGHYLTAIKVYYDLLRHPEYNWTPRAESLLVAGAPVQVDYEDERRFARAAAARARTGAEVVGLTLRQKYGGDPDDALHGYKDANADRAWGVDEWASRTGQAAYFDWVVGNAMLPAQDDAHEGIEKVDRTTVAELGEIPAQFTRIHATLDRADMGLNPVGLAKDAMPFDFDPTFDEVGSGIQGETHFEQMAGRALEAVNNAVTVFNHANESTHRLRQQLDSVGDFQVEVEAEEREFTNRLIEIYGYPYPDDCGPGKTYPQGYSDYGPDLYHFMYVDATKLTGMGQTATPFYRQVNFTNLGLPRYDAYMRIAWSASEPEDPIDIDDTAATAVTFEFPSSDDALGIMTKPKNWTGTRKAPGEAQMALSDLILARAEYLQAVSDYKALIDEIEDNVKLVELQWNVGARELEILIEERDKQVDMNHYIKITRGVQNAARTIAETTGDMFEALSEGFPDDPEKPWEWGVFASKGLMMALGAGLKTLSNIVGDIADMSELALEQEKERISLNANIMDTQLLNRFELQVQLLEIENLVRAEIPLRIEIYALAEAMAQARGQYLSVLAEGERLLEERHVFRTLTAADIQEYRYKDMSFRIFRNDALQKYRAQFEMAALYTYLAAKAYDYETALLDADTRAGRAFFADIARCRIIGKVEDGEPLIGSGLADVLKRLQLNFQVFKPQMGLNNPQFEDNRFSLRSELFRLLPGEGSDDKWRQVLENHRVDDLWQVPEFRRHCKPFAAEGIPQPGIVIPFATNVSAGLNYFGWPLGPADSYYSNANFATKVWSVGVWLSDYDSAGLALTPRVYLVPAGVDTLRSPTGSYGALRNWEVVDQKIPLPFPVNGAELDGSLNWIPTMETLQDELFAIRRHGDFRAYHDSGGLDASEMTSNTRIVGRSVWNTRWILFIPGQNLLADPEEGIDRFIRGQEVINGDGERTGLGVSDIKLYFRTYSYMGN